MYNHNYPLLPEEFTIFFSKFAKINIFFFGGGYNSLKFGMWQKVPQQLSTDITLRRLYWCYCYIHTEGTLGLVTSNEKRCPKMSLSLLFHFVRILFFCKKKTAWAY